MTSNGAHLNGRELSPSESRTTRNRSFPAHTNKMDEFVIGSRAISFAGNNLSHTGANNILERPSSSVLDSIPIVEARYFVIAEQSMGRNPSIALQNHPYFHDHYSPRSNRQSHSTSNLESASQLSVGSVLSSHKLNGCELFSYSIGHVLNDMTAACWFTYLLVFLQKIVKLSAGDSGFVMFAGQGADAISTPLVGLASDAAKPIPSLRLGRRKKWHLIGSVIVAFSFYAVFGLNFFPSSKGDSASLTAYYSLSAAVFNIGWAAIQVSHMSMVPELSPNDNERVVMNSGRYAFTILSNLAVFIIFLLLVNYESPTNDYNAAKFSQLALASIVIGGVCTVIFHSGVNENLKTNSFEDSGAPLIEDARQSDDLVVAVKESEVGRKTDHHHHVVKKWYDWLHEPAFYLIAFVYMMSRLAVNLTQVYLPLFILDTLEMSTADLAIIPLTVYLSSLITTILIKRINDIYDHHTVIIIGAHLIALACFLFFASSELTKGWIVPLGAVFLGSGGALMMIMSVQMVADLIADDIESGAFVYGGLSFTDKLSNGVAILAIQLSQEIYENSDDADDSDGCGSEECKLYIKRVLVFVPMAACCGSSVVCIVMKMLRLPERSFTKH